MQEYFCVCLTRIVFSFVVHVHALVVHVLLEPAIMADSLKRSRRSAAKGAPCYSMDDAIIDPPEQAKGKGRGRGKSDVSSSLGNKTSVGF